MKTFPGAKPRAFSIGAGLLTTFTAAALLSACGGGFDGQPPLTNQLYTQTNDSANSTVHFTRNTDGTLTRQETTVTGGAGTNAVGVSGTTGPDSLAGQHSIIVDAPNHLAYVVNGGDDSISVMNINPVTGALTLRNRTLTTAGHIPNSLAMVNGVLYVTFQRGVQQLAAYQVAKDGSLSLIAGYNLAALGNLSVQVQPTQVVKSPDGAYILVNAGPGTNTTMAFQIKPDGSLATPTLQTALASPFASEFVVQGTSSYYMTTSISGKSLNSFAFSAGSLTAAGSATAVGIAAPCWLSIAPNGTYAYVGNGSGAITAYKIGATGTLTLLNSMAATEPSVITGVPSVSADSWISPDSKYFYVTYLGADKVVTYSINVDGSLTKLGENVVGTTTHLSLQGMAGI